MDTTGGAMPYSIRDDPGSQTQQTGTNHVVLVLVAVVMCLLVGGALWYGSKAKHEKPGTTAPAPQQQSK